MLDEYVSEKEGHGAAFWSNDRLPKLWDEAQAKIRQAEGFTYGAHSINDAVTLAAELEELSQRMEQENSRVRAFLMSRICMSKMAGDAIASMKENGWTLTEASYQRDAQGCEDARRPMQLVFKRDDDEMTIIIYDEYDEATGQYKQGLTRLANEAGVVSEHDRQEEDKRISQSMQNRGYEGFHLTCDQSTVGLKKKIET